jgi:hypothetical protein
VLIAIHLFVPTGINLCWLAHPATIKRSSM